MRGSWLIHLSGALLAAWPAVTAGARAEECRLERVASLAMTQAPPGLLVPVKINGHAKFMIVDTGAPLSAVDPQIASGLRLATRRIRQGTMFTSRGRSFTEMATIFELRMGTMRAADLKFLVYPKRLSGSGDIAGFLGADFLRHYDVEFDFRANRLNLFSQNHCPGKVIYWPADTVAVVPMRISGSGHIIVPVTLEGRALNALFDTGAFATILALETAEKEFGLTPGSPDTPEATSSPRSAVPYYEHVFRDLTLEGISIKNPTVFIRADLMRRGMAKWTSTGTRIGSAGTSGGATSLILGMNELRGLHILISYKEQKLYITSATRAGSAKAKVSD